jgi:pimeloyl-ACP methyl ester carboxylesterase
MRTSAGIIIGCIFACSAVGLATPAVLPVHTVAMPVGQVAALRTNTCLLHLPGIGGRRWTDDQMALGFRDAGYAGELQIYDWTGEATGLGALVGYKRNQAEAQKVADYIVERVRSQPGVHFILTGHSGGTGIAVWALEKLPPDVKIDKMILLASALSPDYDMSKALAHVRGNCYSFCSENDVLVLGAGTKMFGTIDGKKTEAAGQFGFVFPAGGDAAEYAKLVQKPYDKAWLQLYHNLGDHLGCMNRSFVEKVVAPLLAPQEKNNNGADTHQANVSKTAGRS